MIAIKSNKRIKIYELIVITLVIIGVILAVYLQQGLKQQGTDDVGQIQGLISAHIKIYGNTFVAMEYTKEINITFSVNGYVMTYLCENYSDFDHCNCLIVEKSINKTSIEAFLGIVDTLVDEGEEAKCCDHPWTELELIYDDGTSKIFLLSFDPIDAETMFNIDCSII